MDPNDFATSIEKYAEPQRKKREQRKGFFSRAKDWLVKNPGVAALGGAALGGGGVMASRLLRGPAKSTGAINTRLRGLARKGGVNVLVPGETPTPGAKRVKRSFKERAKEKAMNLFAGTRPIEATPEGIPLKGAFTKKQQKGVTVGGTPGDMPSKGEVAFGGGAFGTPQMKKQVAAAEKVDRGGKMFEASKMGIGDFMAPGVNIRQMAKEMRLKMPGRKATVDQQARFLDKLQEGFKKKYGAGYYEHEGFFLKPHGPSSQVGMFPDEHGSWGEMFKGYQTRLKGEMKAAKREYAKSNDPVPWDIAMKQDFGDDPAYSGQFLENALKVPTKVRIERKHEIVHSRGGDPHEYRVHVVGGEVPHDLASSRYSLGKNIKEYIPGARRLGNKVSGSSNEAADWVKKEVMPKMKKEFKTGTLAMDIARVKNPDGTYGYKVIEVNPSSMTGQSGFLDPAYIPDAGIRIKKWVTGYDAPGVTAAKAVGAGAVGAGAVGGAAKLVQQWDKPEDIAKTAARKKKRKTSWQKRLALGLAGGLGGAMLGGAGYMLSKPMTRKHIRGLVRGIGRGGAQAAERSRSTMPPGAVRDAKAVAAALRKRGINPRTARIGIGATGGTGKSTMAKALAKELGMKSDIFTTRKPFLRKRRRELLNEYPLVKSLKKTDVPRGHVVEQSHMLNTLNPDKFDVIIKMEKPLAQIKGQLKARKRGAIQWDYYDYHQAQKGVDHAFNLTKGKAFSPVKGVNIKMKPPGGFKANEMVDARLRGIGVDPSKLSKRHQKLTSLTVGKTTKSLSPQTALIKRRPLIAAGMAGTAGAAIGATAGGTAPETVPDLAALNKARSRKRALQRYHKRVMAMRVPNGWGRYDV